MRRPSKPDVSTWYRDPKDGGVRYLGIDEWGEKIEYFFLPHRRNALDTPGMASVYNYDTGDIVELGEASSEAASITLMQADLVERNRIEDDA